MPRLARSLSIIATVLLACLLPAAAASAKTQPKKAHAAAVTRWAAKHHLKGAWRNKDHDSDGLTNLQEYRLKTDPKKADSDNDGLDDGDEMAAGTDPLDPDTDSDGVKDGAEHPGVVTAFDGNTITVRQYNGQPFTASLDADTDCGGGTGVDDTTDTGADWTPADDAAGADDPAADDSGSSDDGSADDSGDDSGDDSADAPDVAGAVCDPALDVGAVITSVELDTQDDGSLYVVSLELADPSDG